MRTAEFVRILESLIRKQIKPSYAIGTVDPNYSLGKPRIRFDGEQTVSSKRYSHLSSYQPRKSDRVLMAKLAGTNVILGSIGDYRGGTSGATTAVANLDFDWSGTSLGVKQTGDSTYTYVNLKGDVGNTGPAGPQGNTGPQGPQGPQGATGSTGPKGDKGDTGNTGATGPQGPIGLTGPQGPKGDTGEQGPQGLKGDTGDTGPQGLTGPAGPIGPTGSQGPQGVKGDKGDKGDTGEGLNIIGALNSTSELPASGTEGDAYTVNGVLYVWSVSESDWINVGNIKGEKGDTGDIGPAGPTGPQGPQGLKGDTGNTGATGPQGPIGPVGPKGDTGDIGPQGPQGLKGDTGNTGATGPVGPQGPQGLKGDTGNTGPAGPTGATGSQGPQGIQGPTGPIGATGPAGADGEGVTKITPLSATASPTSYPMGVSYFSFSSGMGLGYPIGNGTVMTVKDGDFRIFQTITESTGAFYTATRYGRSDTGWTDFFVTAQETSFTTPALSSGWTNYGGNYADCSYKKSAQGDVSIRGLIRNGTASTIFTLPVGFRPTKQLIFMVPNQKSGSIAELNTRIDVKTTGAVDVVHMGSNGWVSLDGIVFSVL